MRGSLSFGADMAMKDSCKFAAQMIGLVLAVVALFNLNVKIGKLLERLDRIERDYYQGVLTDRETITRAEYMELLKIHVRAGGIE